MYVEDSVLLSTLVAVFWYRKVVEAFGGMEADPAASGLPERAESQIS